MNASATTSPSSPAGTAGGASPYPQFVSTVNDAVVLTHSAAQQQEEELTQTAADLRAEAEDAQPDTQRIRALLSKVGLFLGGAAATGLAEAVSGQVEHVLGCLPGL